jgi:hypothetical protein
LKRFSNLSQGSAAFGDAIEKAVDCLSELGDAVLALYLEASTGMAVRRKLPDFARKLKQVSP